MRRQLELFFTALGFFTRLPVPAWVPWSSAHLNEAARYFSLVGWVVGAIGAAGYLLCVQLLPAPLAVLLAMALMVRITGAFHEDGFADACDGLGGGRDRAHALAIMKDSHLGSYGAVGLVLLLASKAAALAALAAVGDAAVVAALLLAQPLSRLAATCVLHALPYARAGDSGKATLLARPLRGAELACAAAFGALPLLLASGVQALLALFAVAALTAWLMRMFRRRLGGYTGDLLGATQQLAELASYAALLAGHNLAARAADLPLTG